MNVALLGHVDAGKSTLARRLGQLPSTAAFNHAQGRENTVDLGYNSLLVNGERVCLIDCPGHAALIKAVVAASAVIDAAIVVVNATKGVEPQTAEHLLLASLFCSPDAVVVVLSKVDITTKEQREAAEKSVRRALKTLGLRQDAPMLPVCLVDESGSAAIDDSALAPIQQELSILLERKKARAVDLAIRKEGPLLLALDHCFAVKGKGTVLTGSVLEGRVRVGDDVEIPHLNERRRVRELESWKQKRNEVSSGERAALLVAALPSAPSRCLAASPGTLSAVKEARASVEPIAFFRLNVKGGSKIHVSCGYEMEMATARFGRFDEQSGAYELLPEMSPPCSAFLSFSSPLFSRVGSTYVASRLELQARGCRFAFHGRLEESLQSSPLFFSRKVREGDVERVHDSRTLICRGLFKKETNQDVFRNMKVLLETGEIGVVEGPFGASGKARIAMTQPLGDATLERCRDVSGPLVKVRIYMKKFLDEKKTLTSYLPTQEERKKHEGNE